MFPCGHAAALFLGSVLVAVPRAVTTLLVGLAGLFADRRWRPPPGIPGLRPFQRAHHRFTLAWIRRRWPA